MSNPIIFIVTWRGALSEDKLPGYAACRFGIVRIVEKYCRDEFCDDAVRDVVRVTVDMKKLYAEASVNGRGMAEFSISSISHIDDLDMD